MSQPTAEKRAILAWQQQLQADRAVLLTMPAFCRVMHEVLAEAGVFRLSFAGESTHATAFNEGQRNVGLRLLAELERAEPLALQHLRAHARPAVAPSLPEDSE
jgi:hypothetical protein